MFRAVKRGIFCIVFAIGLASVLALGAPQTAVPPAPRPPELFAAKKVFISNASDENATFYVGTADLPYNEFYAAMKNWGRYELVDFPGDADLVLELHFMNLPAQDPQVRLFIRDPKTRNLLWPLTENVRVAARQSTARKNFDQAISALVDDLKKLTAESANTVSK